MTSQAAIARASANPISPAGVGDDGDGLRPTNARLQDGNQAGQHDREHCQQAGKGWAKGPGQAGDYCDQRTDRQRPQGNGEPGPGWRGDPLIGDKTPHDMDQQRVGDEARRQGATNAPGHLLQTERDDRPATEAEGQARRRTETLRRMGIDQAVNSRWRYS